MERTIKRFSRFYSFEGVHQYHVRCMIKKKVKKRNAESMFTLKDCVQENMMYKIITARLILKCVVNDAYLNIHISHCINSTYV